MADSPQTAAGVHRAMAPAIDFQVVVERYQMPLFRFVLNLLRCRPEQAENIVQEVFLRLHRQRQTNGPQSVDNPCCWLFKVARNLATDTIRSRSRQRKAAQHLADIAPKPIEQADHLGDLEHREACRPCAGPVTCPTPSTRTPPVRATLG